MTRFVEYLLSSSIFIILKLSIAFTILKLTLYTRKQRGYDKNSLEGLRQLYVFWPGLGL